MPAPTKSQIQAFLNKDTLKAAIKAALLDGTDPWIDRINGQRQAVWKIDESPLPDSPAVQVQTELPDQVEDLVDAISEALGDAVPEAIAQFWDVWQKSQSVAIITPPLVVVTPDTINGTAIGTVTGPGALP
jgi:hypothetical protein